LKKHIVAITALLSVSWITPALAHQGYSEDMTEQLLEAADV